MMKIIQATIPEKLLKQADIYIEEGWFLNRDSLISEAIRRYIESHKMDIMESFIKEDVEWGLHGKE